MLRWNLALPHLRRYPVATFVSYSAWSTLHSALHRTLVTQYTYVSLFRVPESTVAQMINHRCEFVPD